MNRKVELKSVRVVPGRETEIHKGWVRLSEDSRGDIPSERYVRLAHGRDKIHCQLRGQLGDTPERDCVEMSEYYRGKLHLTVGRRFDIEIEEVGLWGRIIAYCHHPDDTVRAALILGITAVILGIIAVILGGVGLILGLMA